MKISVVLLAVVGISGCASRTPEGVFLAATRAFAKGDVSSGVVHFSTRLKEARPQQDLEYYYRNAQHQRGVAWLATSMNFQVLEQNEDTALARVTCHGRIPEMVYFVRENGAWKLDLGPEAKAASASPVPSP